jgi:hypothetical protein
MFPIRMRFGGKCTTTDSYANLGIQDVKHICNVKAS